MTENGLQRMPNNKVLPTPTRFLNRLFMRPRQHQVTGDVRLGYVYNSKTIYGLSKRELTQHFLVVGRSGAGKTNVLRVMQIELFRNDVPFLSFDIGKYGGRYIKHIIEPLIILRWNKEFLFNFLFNPPGVNLKEWLMVFCSILSEIFDIRPASNLYLMKFIQNLFENLKTEYTGVYPNLHDLSDALEEKLKTKIPTNERGYINTLKSKIEPICLILGDSIKVQKGIPIEKLLNYPVSIELVGIKSPLIQTWIMSMLLAWITCYRESNKMGFGKLKHVFFLDEAHQVLSKGDS